MKEIKVAFKDEQIEVISPDSRNIAYHIANIIQGREYPLVKNPSFVPKQIIDIGANIGAVALFFAKSYPDAKIYCYEPSVTNYSYLQRNTNHLSEISLFNFGLIDSTMKANLFLGKTQCLQHSTIQSKEVGDEFEKIELRKAREELEDKLLEGCILKIDTEGCEVPIIRDLESLIEAADVIYLEYHSEADRRCIDEMLCGKFKLWTATVTKVHRGNLSYLSTRYLSRFPYFEMFEISR